MRCGAVYGLLLLMIILIVIAAFVLLKWIVKAAIDRSERRRETFDLNTIIGKEEPKK